MKKLILLLFFTLSLLVGAQKGSVSLFVFLNGEPYKGMEVTIDGKVTYTTDTKGLVKVYLKPGRHEAKIIQNGNPLAYLKFNVAEDENTQAIVTLNEKGKSAKVDIEEPGGVQQESAAERMAKLENLPKGYLVGKVISSEKKEPVERVKIYVKGLPLDATTDKSGVFNLELPEGNYSLSVIHPDYSTQAVDGILITAKETINKTVEITPAGLELEEFVVLAPHIEGSVAALMDETKKSNAIADILGSEQMSKRGDSSAAAALKRVTGLTLVGGKSIFVRGLGERYANVELNSLPLPSPNPTKRVVPLDLFPSGVIGSMKVQKTFSADIPGSFGGGYIDIRTKRGGKSDYAKVELGVSGNDNTGSKGLTYQGSDTDWWGQDDGYREMDPRLLGVTDVVVGKPKPKIDTNVLSKEEVLALTKTYGNRKYKVSETTTPYGKKGSFEFSKNFEIGSEQKVNILANYAYSQDFNNIETKLSKYDMQNGELEETPSRGGITRNTSSKYKRGGILNLSHTYGNFNTKFTKMSVLNSVNRVKLFEGVIGSNYYLQKKYYLEWEERELDINQLTGDVEYHLFTDMKLEWGLEKATADMYQPNNVKYDYVYSEVIDDYYLNLDLNNMITKQMQSNDTVDGYYLKNKMMFDLFSENDFLEVGIAGESKERISRTRKYYLKEVAAAGYNYEESELTGDIDTIIQTEITDKAVYDNQRQMQITTLFQPSDFFDAELKRNAFYVNTFVQPTESSEIMLGLRNVNLRQTLYEYGPDKLANIAITDNSIEIQKSLPSLSAKYKFSDSDQLKFAYSQNFIYPDFREFSAAEFDHPDTVATIIGNPELEETDITSYDLRYERYFSPTESVSGAFFYKTLINPIEDTQEITSSLPVYGYMNSEKAVLQGYEIDGRKSFDFISDSLEYYFISGNYAQIHSAVTLNEEQKELLTSENRPLQGLSPYVLNVTLSYDNSEDRSVNLSYNKMGERLMKLGRKGTNGDQPDDYETPPAIMDMIWIETFAKNLQLKVKLGNLLDEKTVWRQDDKITQEYRTGKSYSASLSYKF